MNTKVTLKIDLFVKILQTIQALVNLVELNLDEAI